LEVSHRPFRHWKPARNPFIFTTLEPTGSPAVPNHNWVILITDPLAQEGLDVFAKEPRFDVRVRTGLKPDALQTELAQAHALVVRSGTQVTAGLLNSAQKLRVIGRAGTGVDNIDVPAATKRGIVVVNTPGGNSIAACEHTFALLLALLRKIPTATQHLAQGGWDRKRFTGHQLAGKTLGLVGFGRIGREVAVRARAFGMHILVADPFVTESLAKEWEAKLVDLDPLLSQSDVVSLHVPLTPETRNLIDAKALKRIKPGAILVNCARGGLIDEAALHTALSEGTLAGAALDVFAQEPPTGSPLLTHPKVVATPHLGASTEEAQRDVAGEVAEQIRDYLLKGEVRNAVNMPSLSAEAYAQVRPYLDLAERLGSLAGQIVGGSFQRLEVIFRGETGTMPRSPVVSAALVGVLSSSKGGSNVNYVNARLTASELGVEIHDTTVDESGDQPGLVEIALRGKERSASVAGWVTPAGKPRLARWEGLGLDAPPAGDILVLRNPDVPGVVGAIGTLLGDAGVNIAHIAWGRDPASREAFTLINLDGAVSPDLLESICRHPKVLWAKSVRLSPAP
jgi:D-3-phosphoglycerate dehydrogenase / 2-oxoglutarate reductase